MCTRVQDDGHKMSQFALWTDYKLKCEIIMHGLKGKSIFASWLLSSRMFFLHKSLTWLLPQASFSATDHCHTLPVKSRSCHWGLSSPLPPNTHTIHLHFLPDKGCQPSTCFFRESTLLCIPGLSSACPNHFSLACLSGVILDRLWSFPTTCHLQNTTLGSDKFLLCDRILLGRCKTYVYPPQIRSPWQSKG